MKAQRQTLFGGSDAAPGQRGNCFAACVASILEIELALVPNFCGIDPTADWGKRTLEFLEPLGLGMMTCDPGTRDWLPPDMLTIGAGPGPRGHRHCVIYDGRGMVFDPHPSDAGLVRVEEHDVFYVRDAARVLSNFSAPSWLHRIVHVESLPEPEPIKTLDEVERDHVRAVIKQLKGNMTRSAKALGIDRRTLYRRVDHWRVQDLGRDRQAAE